MEDVTEMESFLKDDETIIDLDEEAMDSDYEGLSGNSVSEEENSALETSADNQTATNNTSILSTESGSITELDTSVAENMNTSFDKFLTKDTCDDDSSIFSSQTSSEVAPSASKGDNLQEHSPISTEYRSSQSCTDQADEGMSGEKSTTTSMSCEQMSTEGPQSETDLQSSGCKLDISENSFSMTEGTENTSLNSQESAQIMTTSEASCGKDTEESLDSHQQSTEGSQSSEKSNLDKSKKGLSSNSDTQTSSISTTSNSTKEKPSNSIDNINKLFNAYFPSTDSDSDCERLVLDYKTQSDSESCSEMKDDQKKAEGNDRARTDGKGNTSISTSENNVSEMKNVEEDVSEVTDRPPGELKDRNSSENDNINLEAEDILPEEIQNSEMCVSKDSIETENMEVDEPDSFGPMLSLSAVTHISAEEYEQMGKEETNLHMTSPENDHIDPSEIQSVPVGKSQPRSQTVEEKIPTEVKDKIKKKEKQPIFPVKIKSEPIDDRYDAALVPQNSTSGKPMETTATSIGSQTLVHENVNHLNGIDDVKQRMSVTSTDKSSNQNLMLQVSAPQKLIRSNEYSPPGYIITSAKIPLQNVKQKTIYKAVPVARGAKVPIKKPTQSLNGSRTIIPAPPTVLKKPSPVKVRTDSFNVACITQMMQRKHKIGGHKAEIIPPEYKKYLLNYYPSVCLECGDSFMSKDTIDMHMERVSILIEYDCPLCKIKCTFYNKCSFLSHIRQHNKAQAASKNPAIQVKADILTIRMAPKDKILQSLERTFEPFQTIPIPDKKFTCSECQMAFGSKAELAAHFGSQEIVCSFNFVCYTCNMVMPKKCAFEAHKRYHALQGPHTCPECGEVFQKFSDFQYHIKYVCLHFSRTGFLQCSSINKVSCQYKDVLLTSMTKHLQSQHLYAQIQNDSIDGQDARTTLIFNVPENINRASLNQACNIHCKICDRIKLSKKTLGIHFFKDLRQAQEHMLVHLKEMKRNATFCFICTACPEKFKSIFKTKELLRDHLGSFHQNDIVPSTFFTCCSCNKFFETYPKLLAHQLRVHEYINSEFYFCNYCKTMFESPLLMRKHLCQKPKPFTLKPQGIGGQNETGRPSGRKSFDRKSLPVKILPKEVPIIVKKQIQPTRPPSPPPEKHVCNICQVEFDGKDKILEHNQLEHSSYPCHLCGLTYDSKQKLIRHFEMTHESDKPGYFCLPCKKKGEKKHFNSAGFLEKHLIFKHRISKSRVQRFVNIGRESRNRESTKRILSQEQETDQDTQPVKRLRKDETGAYACVKCTFSTEDSEEFSKHIETHKTVDANQCLECGMCFSVLPSLKRHLFMVHKIKNADEYMKTKGINEPEELPPDSDEEEIQVSSPRKKPIVDLVPIETVRRKDGPVGELECRVCYKEFDNLSLLKNHMRVHGMAFIRSRRAPPVSPAKSDGKESP